MPWHPGGCLSFDKPTPPAQAWSIGPGLLHIRPSQPTRGQVTHGASLRQPRRGRPMESPNSLGQSPKQVTSHSPSHTPCDFMAYGVKCKHLRHQALDPRGQLREAMIYPTQPRLWPADPSDGICVWSSAFLRTQGILDGGARPRGPLLGNTHVPPTPTGREPPGAAGGHYVSSADFSHTFFLCSPNSCSEVLTPELGLLASRAVRPRTLAWRPAVRGPSLGCLRRLEYPLNRAPSGWVCVLN